MEYKNMKKIIILIIISLLIPTTVMARNISVPQSINVGDILIGKTNGSYSPISGTTTMASTTGWLRSGNNVYTASSSYNVGIGTTTPDANLDVQSSGEGTSYGLKIRNPNDKTKYFSIYPDTGGQTGMNIGGSGNPLKFQLLATFYSGVSVTGGQSVELQSNNNGYSSIMASASDSRNMLFKTNLVNRMIIDSNGNVGIGTTSPGFKLDVYSTTARLGTNNTATYWQFTDSTRAMVGYDNLNNAVLQGGAGKGIGLVVNNGTFGSVTPALQILPSGFTGIGTSTPGAKLTVAEGDIYIASSTRGIILKDSVSGCYRFTSVAGVLTSASVTCP